MTEKNEVFKQKIKHNGYWKFKDLYNFSFEQMKDRGYKISEKEYEEKIGTSGKDIKITWEATKTSSDYFKNKYAINWKILGLKDAEVEIEGVKQSMNKGDLTIAITATLERDYDNEWGKKPTLKFMRGIYDRYIIKTTIDTFESKLGEEAKGIVGQMKSFLNLST